MINKWKKPSCECLQEAALHECADIDFFYDNKTGDMTIECCFYNPTSEVQEDVDLEWNFCPQCGAEYTETNESA